MQKQQYIALRQQFAKAGWLKGHNGVAAFMFALESLILLGGFYGLSKLEHWSWPFLLCQLFLATSVFRFFVLLHDCGHYSLFAGRQLNTTFGSLAGIFALTPFIAWRDIHFEHHRWVGVIDKDPTAAGLIDFENRQQYSPSFVALLRAIWWLRLPVPSILFTVNTIWAYPLRLWHEGKKRKARVALLSLVTTILPHVALIAWIGGSLYLTYVVPVLLLSYVWYELVNLTHHAGLYKLNSQSHPHSVPVYEQAPFCRSAQMPTWLSFVLCYHFNLHTEHHVFPSVPFHHLPKVQAHLKQLSDQPYNGVSFPGFNQRLRQADPVDVLLNRLPDHLS